MTRLKPLDYEILRGVPVGDPEGFAHTRAPKLVATLLDEQKFRETGLILHKDTAYIEPSAHRWNFVQALKRLFYYSHICMVGDLLVVYEFERASYGHPVDIVR